MEMKKFLDQTGISVIWSKIEDNYPTNDDLTNIVNAIDETKADKTDLVGKNVTGEVFELHDNTNTSLGTTVTAASGAEIFNDYAENIASGTMSHAEGKSTVATGAGSHAEGSLTIASGTCSHAEGAQTISSGSYSHAEGLMTTASGDHSHAEGQFSIASNQMSHAEGYSTEASGNFSHAEGRETTASANGAHAEGIYTIASAYYSHAEGEGSVASGETAHAEGAYTTASGSFSHAEGINTIASGVESHAEGEQTIAYGNGSHSEGNGEVATISSTITGGAGATTYTLSAEDSIIKRGCIIDCNGISAKIQSCSEDGLTIRLDKTLSDEALNDASIVVLKGISYNSFSHAEGNSTTASGVGSHAEGNNTIASGNYTHAEGQTTMALGGYSHSEGYKTISEALSSHAEGSSTTASGVGSHAEGGITVASADYSHAEGAMTRALSKGAHAEGVATEASSEASHAEGSHTIASGAYSHAEGKNTIALGENSHAEGVGIISSITVTGDANTTTYTVTEWNSYINNNIAVRYGDTFAVIISYSEIDSTITLNTTLSSIALTNIAVDIVKGIAFNKNSHVEGAGNTAVGLNSHAEGSNNITSGISSHAEGSNNIAIGMASHAEGTSTIAFGSKQHVQGTFNIGDTANIYAHIVGNGSSEDTRSNAHTLDWSGNAWFAGDVRVGGTNYNEGFDVPLTTKINIPKGRMKGDINGDGRITYTDANIINEYFSGNQSFILDEIQLWCADVSNDGSVNSSDSTQIKRYVDGLGCVLTATPTLADYYNNWTYEKVDNLSGYFYVDYHIEGMTADSSATLIINDSIIEGNFAELVCSENNLRLYANFCPVNDQTAILIWSKTGNTTSIVDNVIGRNDNSYTTSIQIPKGRMKGDINGDGKINGADFELMVNHLNGTSVITNTTQLWCLDVNSSGTYSIMDQQALGEIINGTSTIALADYYDNWTFNTTDRLFYTDITIAGMTSACSATLFVQGDFEKGNYVKIECLDNAIRIYAKYCPISAFNATVSWTVDGLAVTNVIENPLADTGTQPKLVDIIIPYGRMRGDVDGDGEITDEDTNIVLKHVISGGGNNAITDEETLSIADMTNDGNVNMDDVTALQFITSGKKRIGEYGEISGNWTIFEYYDASIFQFYTDITIPDMTPYSNVTLYIDNGYTSKTKFMLQPQYGSLRIYTTLCPIENINCTVSYTINGSSRTSIIQNKPDAVDTSDYIIEAGDRSIATQEVCNIYNSGRTVWCSYNAVGLLLPVSYVDDNYIEFYMVYDNVAYKLIYQEDVWSVESTKLSDITVMLEEQTLTDTQKEQVRTNIGAAPVYTYGETDLEAGVSELATGTLYFVYE